MTPVGMPLRSANVSFPGTRVYNAASTPFAAFTNLDLSAVVGAARALVVVHVIQTNNTSCNFREDGFTYAGNQEALGYSSGGTQSFHLVRTSTAGVVEWKTGVDAGATTVDVLMAAQVGS